MALSTTQSIWRSGGGDNTRTAYCGSGLMAAQFYIANAAASGATVKVSDAADAADLVLPRWFIARAILRPYFFMASPVTPPFAMLCIRFS